jgi:hypothetical protein
VAQDTITEEAFIQAYSALRKEGLQSPMMEITGEGRDRVLAELGLTEEDLLKFVEVWGSHPGVMQRVWDAVDSLQREDRVRARGDTPESEDEGRGSEDQDPGEEG